MKKYVFASLLFLLPLLAVPRILVFAGSTRTDSINKQVARNAAGIMSHLGAHPTFLDLKDFAMPLYDGDLEENEGMPTLAKLLRRVMTAHDTIVIVSPEYNGSIPAVLKNVLDWVSRDEKGGYSGAAFEGKKFALISASPGSRGGARALVHLRDIIQAAGGTVVEKTVSIGNAYEPKAIENAIPSIVEELRELIDEHCSP